MFESEDGLLTPWTRQNGGRLGIVTVSESCSAPAGTLLDSTIAASPNVRPLSVAHAAVPAPGAAAGRSGPCAETRMAAARNAAAPTDNASFSIMAASVWLFSRGVKSEVVTLRPLTGTVK